MTAQILTLTAYQIYRHKKPVVAGSPYLNQPIRSLAEARADIERKRREMEEWKKWGLK